MSTLPLSNVTEQFAELVQLAPWTVRQHIRARRIPATYLFAVDEGRAA